MWWHTLRSVTAAGLLISLLTAACAPPTSKDTARTEAARTASPVTLTPEVLAVYPHDTGAFTEGLEFHDSELYESVGTYGHSELRTVDMTTGAVLRRTSLPDNLWAEGMTIVDKRVWQLTYREQVALTWDKDTFTQVSQSTYPGEGWGLCYQDSTRLLVMSNGSDQLVFRDPVTFAEVRSVQVTGPGLTKPTRLNELECVGDEAWAVLYPYPRLVRVDLTTGKVTAQVDASGLLSVAEAPRAADLNGIAAIPGTDTFLITGKYWPKAFQVRLVRESG